MNHPSESLKSFANRIARLALSKDGSQAIRLLRHTGLLAPANNTPASPLHGPGAGLRGQSDPCGSANPDRVGIWERRVEDGKTYFVRSKETAKDWRFWANVGRIAPKQAKKRVVLIGESVARGFLYDPLFTPAMALESILQEELGKDEIEVVDLARTNVGFEVANLAISALHLDPDLVIIFSGNNWDKGAPRNSDIPSVDTALRERGILGMKNLAEAGLAQHVAAVVKQVSDAYQNANIPLVWIIPEFNLGDWRDQTTNAPYLIEGHNQRWIALREGAERALQVRDYKTAARLAGEMVELDHACCVTPLYILAECCRSTGDQAGRRHYLELARDAAIWDTSKNTAPRTYSVTEKTLREEIPKYCAQCVDLPKLFREYLQGEVPDRRLFVDYCHLSSEGIQVAMAAAASAVLRLFQGAEIPWRALMKKCVLPSADVEAETAFLAAVHNAHWWQPAELVQHYCMRAVQSSRAILKVMTDFIDLQTRRTPMLMCRATEDLAGLGSHLMQHYLLRSNYQRLDTVLLDSVAIALSTAGVNAQRQLDQLRRQEHSVTHRDVNLLDYYYCAEGLQQQEIMWNVAHLADYLSHKPNHYYKAYWRESRFAFIGEANHAVRLRLTCRRPHPVLGEESASMYLNDCLIGKVSIGPEWQSWDITVPGNVVKDGLNKIAIHWPIPEFDRVKQFECVALDLVDKMYPEFFCVFGEIHSFVASDGDQVPRLAVSSEPELNEVTVS